ncbi:lasso peptide biosynthesis PqqD family chaperone [Saccharothrix xinjiangensis]|uniref:Lasso peptide biosynthesis PqqD family chaperone n=1 Tax=Saccharothrix xinjiangensis TaxID=204798 RepID=A0ABV9Y2G0_9PSEU
MNLRLRPDVATTATEHGTVLLDERTGRYFQLNPTGTRVLHALLDNQAADRIAGDLAADHHLDPGQVQHDVTALIGRLRTANLVVES